MKYIKQYLHIKVFNKNKVKLIDRYIDTESLHLFYKKKREGESDNINYEYICFAWNQKLYDILDYILIGDK